MQAPAADDEELDWLIDDEVTYGPDARRGVVVALSAHGHLRRDHQTVRVRWSDGWGAEQEVSATHPTLRRADRFELPTPTTVTLPTALSAEDHLTLSDEEEKKPTKTMRRTPAVMEEEDDDQVSEQKKRRLNIEEGARDEPKRHEEAKL